MSPMPFVTKTRTFGLAALVAAALVPGVALAETGTPLPQGYTGDVTTVPQGQAPAQPSSDEYADQDPSALTDFQEPLQPYGQWVQDPTYGTIWVPDAAQVGADFAPYQTNGQWATDDNGEWMWQSDYAWGYIPFHYGRWVWAGSYWGWIPGRAYAPAWVAWRVGEDGYIGWAPLPPTWYWAGDYAVGLWSVPYAAYCFVPTSYVFYNNVSNYVVRDRGTIQHAAQSTRPYHPATPTAGHVGARGRLSPTYNEAHIPAQAIPAHHVSRDTRAASYATRSATAAVLQQRMATRQHVLPSANSANSAPTHADAWHSSYNYNRARPVLRTPQGGSPQTFQSGFSPQASQRVAPSFHSSAPAPAYHSGFSPQASQRVAPSFHYTPAQTFHPPATTHTSVPSSSTTHTSAPHASGVHVGGGHHR